jgi:tellurite resistance protein
MIKVDTAAIAALRDRLLESGGAPSVILSAPDALHRASPMEGDAEAIAMFEACFEGMYLMLAADGKVADQETDLLRGAIRELTAGAIRSAEIDKMAATACARVEAEGPVKRLETIASALKGERVAAEAAFVLAAAMAFADSEIADEENEQLNNFAELLEIDVDRANELLDQLETADE